MKFKTRFFVFFVFLSFGIQTTESQMESKTLIQLLNFSNTLIQDGEIKFLIYRNFPIRPDDLGGEHQMLLANWEKQLIENPPNSKNPEALRKEILGYLEREKRYGNFRDSEDRFVFIEGNLVFQNEYVYRLEATSRFEKFPSLAYNRFFNGGGLFFFASNGKNKIKGRLPEQFANDNRIGSFELSENLILPDALMAMHLPSFQIIDETQAEVQLIGTDVGDPTYIITHFPYERVKAKVYVKLKSGLPEVYQVKYYYLSDSPRADEEGYWLREINIYSDFEWVEELNINVPKVRELQEFCSEDEFMRHHGILMIKEMNFNLGLPDDFFECDVKEMSNDSGRRKRIRGMDSE